VPLPVAVTLREMPEPALTVTDCGSPVIAGARVGLGMVPPVTRKPRLGNEIAWVPGPVPPAGYETVPLGE